MSKVHWNTVDLEGSLSDPFVKKLIDHSYELIVNSLPKKIKEEWASL
jgi:predicted DNA-binding protein (MmcQ/YjbR family)